MQRIILKFFQIQQMERWTLYTQEVNQNQERSFLHIKHLRPRWHRLKCHHYSQHLYLASNPQLHRHLPQLHCHLMNRRTPHQPIRRRRVLQSHHHRFSRPACPRVLQLVCLHHSQLQSRLQQLLSSHPCRYSRPLGLQAFLA